MKDYEELIKKSLEVLSYAEQINPNAFYLTRADLKIIADAIEQLVKERDKLKNDLWKANDTIEYANYKLKEAEKRAEEKCNTCKYHFEVNWERRGVQE